MLHVLSHRIINVILDNTAKIGLSSVAAPASKKGGGEVENSRGQIMKNVNKTLKKMPFLS